MEKTNEGYVTNLFIKLQEQALLNKANILYHTHMNNLRNLMISGAKLNEMNLLFNTIFPNNSLNNLNNSSSTNEENQNKINFKSFDGNGNGIDSNNTPNNPNIKPIRFLIEKDKNEFIEKKNFFIKDVVIENSKKIEKRFVCNNNNCKKEYKSKENLILHIKNKHHGEKPYFCKYCGKKYSHRSGNNFFFIFFT